MSVFCNAKKNGFGLFILLFCGEPPLSTLIYFISGFVNKDDYTKILFSSTGFIADFLTKFVIQWSSFI
jgi:hypothetical protein